MEQASSSRPAGDGTSHTLRLSRVHAQVGMCTLHDQRHPARRRRGRRRSHYGRTARAR